MWFMATIILRRFVAGSGRRPPHHEPTYAVQHIAAQLTVRGRAASQGCALLPERSSRTPVDELRRLGPILMAAWSSGRGQPMTTADSKKPDIDFEHEKWREEIRLRERELQIKEQEQRTRDAELELKRRELGWSRWTNPLVVAIFVAAVAAFGNIIASVHTSREQRQLEESKNEAARVLEMIKSKEPERTEGLGFLLGSGLIANQATRNQVSSYINSKSSPASWNETSITCDLKQDVGEYTAVLVAGTLLDVLSADPFLLEVAGGADEGRLDRIHFNWHRKFKPSQLFRPLFEMTDVLISVSADKSNKFVLVDIRARIKLSPKGDTNEGLYWDAGSDIARTYFSRLSDAISRSLMAVASNCRGDALVRESK
jgi:hypothetical protein